MILIPINSWSTYKSTVITTKALLIQYKETPTNYEIFAAEDLFVWTISIAKDGGSDVTDFENNFKSNANKPIVVKDSDGSTLARIKAAPVGWTFQLRGFEFITSTLSNPIINLDTSGNALSDITCKIYDNNGNEITTPGPVNANLLLCVKTVIDFEPPYDYYMIGAKMRILTALNSDVRVTAVVAPDITYQNGGSRVLAQNVNFRYIAAGDKFDADGRAAKFLPYSSQLHSNKIRIILNHAAGAQHSFSLNIEHFKA